MNDLHELAICGESLIIVFSCCIINGLNGTIPCYPCRKKRRKSLKYNNTVNPCHIIIPIRETQAKLFPTSTWIPSNLFKRNIRLQSEFFMPKMMHHLDSHSLNQRRSSRHLQSSTVPKLVAESPRVFNELHEKNSVFMFSENYLAMQCMSSSTVGSLTQALFLQWNEK